jgi:hypothetical protein
MTLTTPPSWLQAGSYPAQFDRIIQQALYDTTGIIGASSLAVSPNSPVGMSVRVASGWGAVVGTTTTDMGTYTFYNDATDTLTITTADPTLDRIDLVCVTVRDAFYSGAFNDVIFQVIPGTPNASPVAPALPANSLSLATVLVATAVTQINSGDITDTRVPTTTNLSVSNDPSTVTLTGVQTLTNKTLTAPVINLDFNPQTGTSYTLNATDKNKLVTFSNAGTVTVTVPSGVFAAGQQINLQRIGTGAVQIRNNGTSVLTSTGATSGAPNLRAAFSACTIICTSSNNFTVIGDLS